MRELREQIQVWLKENETEYYGLDRDSVNTALWAFEDVIDKVEEMQKVLEQTRTGISNAYEFGYLKETDQNDVHNMIERINEVLKGESK